jgi:hypothetical protein
MVEPNPKGGGGRHGMGNEMIERAADIADEQRGHVAIEAVPDQNALDDGLLPIRRRANVGMSPPR